MQTTPGDRFPIRHTMLAVGLALLMQCGQTGLPHAAAQPESATPAAEHPFVSVSLTPRAATGRFIVTGDTGATKDRLLAGMKKVQAAAPVDAILLLGDNFYECGVRSVDDPGWEKVRQHFSPLGVPIFPVLGNHDYGEPVRCRQSNPAAQVAATGQIPNWTFPDRSYRITTPDADIFMVDAFPIAIEADRPYKGSQTAAQIVDELDQGLARSRKPLKIVASHMPLYSSGPHGHSHGPQQLNMRDALLPLFSRYHVGLYLSGHDHSLELLGKPGASPVYLLSGAGSELTRQWPREHAGSEPPTIYPHLPAKQFYGFALLEVNADGSFAITFYDAEGTARSETYRFS